MMILEMVEGARLRGNLRFLWMVESFLRFVIGTAGLRAPVGVRGCVWIGQEFFEIRYRDRGAPPRPKKLRNVKGSRAATRRSGSSALRLWCEAAFGLRDVTPKLMFLYL